MGMFSKHRLVLFAGLLAGNVFCADIPLDLGDAKNWSTYRNAAVKNSSDTSGALIFHLPTFATRTWRIPHQKAEQFNQTGGIAFKVKGDGKDSWLTVRVFPVSLFFQYCVSVPVKGRQWQDVTIAWEDFINLSNRNDLPLGKSALFVQGLFGFMAAWNDVQWAQLIIGSAPRTTWTLAYGLKVISDNSESYEAITLSLASAVIAMIPIFIVYLLAQSKIIEGVAQTGIKH